MKREEARRRYLEARQRAGTTGLDADAREAHLETARQLERKYAGLREEALAATRQDFDRQPHAGVLEHQRYERGQAQLTEHDLGEIRKRMRAPAGSPSTSRQGRRPAARRAAVRAGVAGGRAYRQSKRAVVSSSGVQSAGSLTLEAIGVAVGLALLYLALSPNGSAAFAKLLQGVEKAVRLLVAPIDPLHPGSPSSSSTTSGTPAQIGPQSRPAGAAAASPVQRRRLGTAFGPAPGIGTPITPIGAEP